MTTFKALHKMAIPLIASLSVLAFSASPAFAESPWWHLSSVTRPSYLAPGGKGVIALTASNLGEIDANPEIQPVTITDELPKGLEAVAVEGSVDESLGNFGFEKSPPIECSTVSAESVSCTFTGKNVPPYLEEGNEAYPTSVPPYHQIDVRISVKVKRGGQGARSGEENVADIAGGGLLPRKPGGGSW